MQTIRILLVEDSPAYMEVVAFALSNEPDIEIVRQCSTADAALRFLDQCTIPPDLILLDLNLPGISGIEAIPKIKQSARPTEIIVLTESEKEADIIAAIKAGAVGYLLKESSLDQIIEGIHTVIAGGASLDPVMARYLLANQKSNTQVGESQLSPRELEILTRLANGMVQKQIAEDLSISPKTVDFHVGNIYKKLNAQNAPSAVAQAYKTGIFTQNH